MSGDGGAFAKRGAPVVVVEVRSSAMDASSSRGVGLQHLSACRGTGRVWPLPSPLSVSSPVAFVGCAASALGVVCTADGDKTSDVVVDKLTVLLENAGGVEEDGADRKEDVEVEDVEEEGVEEEEDTVSDISGDFHQPFDAAFREMNRSCRSQAQSPLQSQSAFRASPACPDPGPGPASTLPKSTFSS